FDTYSPNKKVVDKDLGFIDLLLTYFDMEHVGSRTFNVLSSGQQQIIIFIRALVQSPELLLLDEPYQGLDWVTVKKCNYLLTMLLENSDVALIFVSHFAQEIPEIVDEYYLIDQGKLVKMEK
ncbi:MAG: ATP-binding cassette domain-containing protein, partial [Bacteroidia bacterium]|nr:ATP-binding cassette domain-containing protein [Bacteroidia bacterium]